MKNKTIKLENRIKGLLAIIERHNKIPLNSVEITDGGARGDTFVL